MCPTNDAQQLLLPPLLLLWSCYGRRAGAHTPARRRFCCKQALSVVSRCLAVCAQRGVLTGRPCSHTGAHPIIHTWSARQAGTTLAHPSRTTAYRLRRKRHQHVATNRAASCSTTARGAPAAATHDPRTFVTLQALPPGPAVASRRKISKRSPLCSLLTATTAETAVFASASVERSRWLKVVSCMHRYHVHQKEGTRSCWPKKHTPWGV